jgi:hypothetical protein
VLLSCADIGVGLVANTIFLVELIANQLAGNIDCLWHLFENRSSIVLTNIPWLTVTAIYKYREIFWRGSSVLAQN